MSYFLKPFALRYLMLTWGLLWAAEGVQLPGWLLKAAG